MSGRISQVRPQRDGLAQSGNLRPIAFYIPERSNPERTPCWSCFDELKQRIRNNMGIDQARTILSSSGESRLKALLKAKAEKAMDIDTFLGIGSGTKTENRAKDWADRAYTEAYLPVAQEIFTSPAPGGGSRPSPGGGSPGQPPNRQPSRPRLPARQAGFQLPFGVPPVALAGVPVLAIGVYLAFFAE